MRDRGLAKHSNYREGPHSALSTSCLLWFVAEVVPSGSCSVRECGWNQVRQQVLQVLADSGSHMSSSPKDGDIAMNATLTRQRSISSRLLRRHNIDPDETEAADPRC